jgi:hypothetical protein
MKKLVLFTLFVACFFNMQAQEKPEMIDFYKEIKNYDLSVLINPDSIFDNLEQMVKRDEPLGFIGENYQRFHIHFISIIQNPNNNYEYLVYGKTKVNRNICEFIGSLEVKETKLCNEHEVQIYNENIRGGFVTFEVQLFENKKQSHTGFFRGNMTCDFLIYDNGKIIYDAFIFGSADGFNNNQFIGTWTSYETGKSKKCNFGDFRIPEFDCGDGQFFPCDQYIKNGWQSYVKCIHSDYENMDKNCKEEFSEWWK